MRKHTNTFAWALAVCAVAVLVGCGKTEKPAPPPYVMPEVNDANCKSEAITAMDAPLATRQQFASLCARRPGPPMHSEQKSYKF